MSWDEGPIARRLKRRLVGDMKPLQTQIKSARTMRDQKQSRPEPVNWHKAVPPKIGGHRPDVERDPLHATEEWRPGEAAKRGYEKAVEDWWWL